MRLIITHQYLYKSKKVREQTSIIGQAFQYDTLNDRINPTEGYRIRLDVDYFGLTGDSEHLMTELRFQIFTGFQRALFLGTFLEGGFIASINEVKLMIDSSKMEIGLEGLRT